MALTDIETVRLIIGDTPTSPFYPIFNEDELQQFLDINGGSVRQASRMAAIAASMQLAGYTSRERSGEIEVWSNLSTAYLAALKNLINDSGAGNLPNGLMPYASGISWADMCANNANPDNVRSPLTKVKVCDTPVGGFALDTGDSCGC